LVLTELSLIQRILLTSHRFEVGPREGNTEKREALLAEILLHTHGIGLVNLTLLDPRSTGGAHARTAGAGDRYSSLLRSRQNSLIVSALKLMLLAIKLNGDGINSWSGVAHHC
jgi:hypothetical protein